MNGVSFFRLGEGLFLLLLGMKLMSGSFSEQADSLLKSKLSRLTDSTLRGFLLGAVAAVLVQSSSAVTVMAVGLVGSGTLTLHQSAGVLMGANVGATATPWLFCLAEKTPAFPFPSIAMLAPAMALAGVLLFRCGKRKRTRQRGKIVFGAALLFSGMHILTLSAAPLGSSHQVVGLLLRCTHPASGMLTGAALTAVLQSSGAGLALLQALAAGGRVTVGTAVPLILGQNIGTCSTALIASAAAGRNARRAALIHLGFNLTEALLCGGGFSVFARLNGLSLYHPASPAGIALLHTLFNLFTAAVLLPFCTLFPRNLAHRTAVKARQTAPKPLFLGK